MKDSSKRAVCGLDCSECNFFQARTDEEKAKKIVKWMKEKKNIDVDISDVGCAGCRGDKSEHHSPDCAILKCCVDQRGLDYCCECSAFPCVRLTERTDQSERYTKALNWLKEHR